jgi:hypothetical protein
MLCNQNEQHTGLGGHHHVEFGSVLQHRHNFQHGNASGQLLPNVDKHIGVF